MSCMSGFSITEQHLAGHLVRCRSINACNKREVCLYRVVVKGCE